VPGVIAAEGVVGVEGFAAGVDDGAAGVIAAEGVVVDGLAAGVCDGGVLRLARSPAAGVDVPGVTAAEGVVGVAAGVCEGAGLALPAGAGVPGVIAADGDDGAPGFAAGPCNGVVAGLALPGAADGVPGVIAAEGVAGVTGVPVADVPVAEGSGCPFIPGSGWPRCGGGWVAADAGAFGCAPACGLWGCSVAAFCATEGGSEGAAEAAGAGAAGADAAGAGAACGDVACGDAAAGCAAGAMAAAGGMVCVWPLGFVIVTVFVTLLTTTVLWTLL
jgi:hypothetical protein